VPASNPRTASEPITSRARGNERAAASVAFTRYQRFVVALLAFLQFTVVLDFMILSPLSAIVMPALHVTPRDFGLVVSAYAWSAGAAGIVAAGFADRYDRKRMLLIFYAGFLIGTVFCGLASTYGFLLCARIVTGLFGGVIGAINAAIVADLFPLQVRGRVMGSIQSAFAAAQIMGVPIALFLANQIGWHGPFFLVAAVGMVVGIIAVICLRPLTGHLHAARPPDPIRHLLNTASNRRYLVGFSATILVATGGFMLQPFASAFLVRNVEIPVVRLPLLYMVSGTVAMMAGPLLGRLSDSFGKYRIFCFASLAGICAVLWITSLGPSSLAVVMLAQGLLSIAIAGRMVTTMAMISAVPALPDRGAYMAVSSSMQQFAGGLSAWIAGLVVYEGPGGRIENYHILGSIVVVAMVITVAQMLRVHRLVDRMPPYTPPVE